MPERGEETFFLLQWRSIDSKKVSLQFVVKSAKAGID